MAEAKAPESTADYGLQVGSKVAPQRKKKKRWLCNYSRQADQINLANPNYRKDGCRYDTTGNCKYGKTCYFAHSLDEVTPERSAQRSRMRKVRTRRENTPSSSLDLRRTLPRREPYWSHRDIGEAEAATQDSDDGKWDEIFCPFFQVGCCYYEDSCIYQHRFAAQDTGYKTSLCCSYHTSGTCDKADCVGAHGVAELRTPAVWQGVPGYKASLCTFFMMDDLECGEKANCPDAHGHLDLRRLPLSVPPELMSAAAPVYSDAHVHLDQVLLSRKYGTCWFYKRSPCRYKPCNIKGCAYAHANDKRRHHPIESGDLEELATVIRGLQGASFGGCVHSCCELDTISDTLRIIDWGCAALDGKIYAAFGIHPTTFEACTPEALSQLEAAVDKCGPKAVAWGECGLDYYRRWLDIENDPTTRPRMREAFAAQAKVAVRRGLPLVVHSRDAEEDTLEVLRETVPREHPVYLHSYTGSAAMMQEFLEFWPQSYVGMAGCVSYEAAWQIHDLAEALPLGRLLLETDGPYMAPVPHRGEESHPGHIPWVAKGVANVKGISMSEVLAAAHANFLRFYRL